MWRNYSLEEYEINNGASRHFPHAIALTQQIGPFTLKFDSKLAIDVKQMRRHKYCDIRLSWISFLVFLEVMGYKFVQLFLSFYISNICGNVEILSTLCYLLVSAVSNFNNFLLCMSMLRKHTAYYGPPQLIDGKLEGGTRSIFLIVSNAIILSRRFTRASIILVRWTFWACYRFRGSGS